MKRKLIIYLIFIGFIGIWFSCQKETKTTLLTSSGAPTIKSMPAFTNLSRDKSGDTLMFLATAANPGFKASANYFLEVDSAGDQFQQPIILFTGIQDSVIEMSVNYFDNLIIQRFPISQAASLEFRIRAVLVADAGTGAVPIVLTSVTTPVSLTPYGPPTLAITPDGNRQGITSPSNNGIYSGFIYSDGTTPFTFTNLDNGKIYGGTNNISGTTKVVGVGVLTEGGLPITLPKGGYDMVVDLTKPSIALNDTDMTLCAIGDATPGGWGTDSKMVWRFKDHSWNVKLPLVTGGIKFRIFGDWGNGLNLGYDKVPDLNNLLNAGSSANITIGSGTISIAPGTYNIKVFATGTPYKAVFTPAN